MIPLQSLAKSGFWCSNIPNLLIVVPTRGEVKLRAAATRTSNAQDPKRGWDRSLPLGSFDSDDERTAG